MPGRFGWRKTWHEALWQIFKGKNHNEMKINEEINKMFYILESPKFPQVCKHVTTWDILEHHVQIGIVLLKKYLSIQVLLVDKCNLL
jgi:hypothetical protein